MTRKKRKEESAGIKMIGNPLNVQVDAVKIIHVRYDARRFRSNFCERCSMNCVSFAHGQPLRL
jgi:hypothetical protein